MKLIKYSSCLAFLCIASIITVLAQSKAHKESKFAIIDPAYSSSVQQPAAMVKKDVPEWLYGAGELECFRLDLLQSRKDSAKLNVGYTGVFHHAFEQGSFQLILKVPQKLNSINFNAVGKGMLLVNGAEVERFNASHLAKTIVLKNNTAVKSIRFELEAPGELPALLINNKELSQYGNQWEWCSPKGKWEKAFGFEQNLYNLPPHRLEDPSVKVNAVAMGPGLFDFGRELLGHVFIKSHNKPVIRAGESKEEALAVGHEEQSSEMISLSDGLWRTQTRVACRYVYFPTGKKEDIWVEAFSHPEIYQGAFACSDTLLTRIWMNSAYTLRLCMHDFLLDGIKRDRLPWAGDLAMSSLVNAYSFGDRELVRRSLVAIGREGIKEQDINGIADFSLWWVISQDQYQLYFDDKKHLEYEWPRIKETLDFLKTLQDENGFIVPRKKARVFIDWVKQEKWTSLQILWWWAQNSAANLAERAGDIKMAQQWKRSAVEFKEQLFKAAWNNKEQRWYSKADSLSEKTRHPNFFAVVAGLNEKSQYEGIRRFLQSSTVKPVGSPYMAGYEMIGIARLGATKQMLDRVREYWGGMLTRGATTFWEAYGTKESVEKQYAFYIRPFGKSLCHAWSSGPAAFLPAELFGLRPTADGWKRFSLKPDLGDLSWVSASVPIPFGTIQVDIDSKNMKVIIPAGTTLEWNGQQIAGPLVYKTVRQPDK